MSRDASTDEKTEEIYNLLRSGNCNTQVKLQVYSDGTYYDISDLDVSTGVTWTEGGKSEKFADYALTPLSSTINFNVINHNGRYSNGSDTAYEGRLGINSKVRLKAGYKLSTQGAETTDGDIINTGSLTSVYFYTAFSSGTIIPSASNTTIDIWFTDLFDVDYDSETYDDSTYTPAGYSIQLYENTYLNQELTKFTVTANNTDGNIYYLLSDELQISTTSADWTDGGATVNGTKTIDFIDVYDRYLYVAIVFDGIAFDITKNVSDISVYYEDDIEWMYTSIFRLTAPVFTDPKSPELPIIQCRGFDDWHKAVSTDINLADLSGGTTLLAVLQDVCTKCGITYTATSLSIGMFSNRVLSSGVDNLKASKIFKNIMEVLSSSGYQMWLEYDSTEDENVLYVQPTPSTYTADGAMSYKNYENIGSNKQNADKLLQRLTAITNAQVVSEEVELGSTAFSATGTDETITWSGEAIYKRVVTDNNDNITFDNFVCNNESVVFDITAITGTVTVTVYGNKWVSAPTFEGEAIQIDNMLANRGSTARIENLLFISDAECKTVSEAFISGFGTLAWEAKGMKYPYLNLLHSNNDLLLLWRRFIFNDDLFFLIKQTHHWNKGARPDHYTMFNFEDSTLNYSSIGDFIYDDEMDYDRGYIWDMGISTPLNTSAEIDAATTIINNTDMA